MNPGFMNDSKGLPSTMRLGVVISIALGVIVVLGGLVGWFMRLGDASLIIGAGSGLITFALGAKAWQAQAEYKNP